MNPPLVAMEAVSETSTSLDRIEGKVDHLGGRVDAVEGRLEGVQARIAKLRLVRKTPSGMLRAAQETRKP